MNIRIHCFRSVSLGLIALAGLSNALAQTPIGNYVVSTSSGASIVPGTTDIGNHCDDCTTPITLPFPFQFYDEVFTAANISANGNIQFGGSNTSTSGCLPNNSVSRIIAAHWSDLYTVDANSGQGIFTSVSGTAPNRIFNIEWRARFCCSSGPPTQNFEVRLYENGGRIDIIYGSPGGGGIGLQNNNCQFTAVSCGIAPAAGTQYTFTPQPAPPPLPEYRTMSTSGASIVRGTTDIGNHCDDCTTPITLPFPFQFYDEVFTAANISANGNIQFNSNSTRTSGCLPDNSIPRVIAAHWSDLYTFDASSGQGIFTSVSGTAPNRIFNVEWRARFCCNSGPPTQNFEVRLYENGGRIDMIYGSPGGGGIGLQRDNCHYTAVSCGTNPPAVGTQHTFVRTGQLISATSAIQAEGCAPANGALDPGEAVMVDFCVQNLRDETTSNLVGTLQATDEVINPSEPQTYGVLAPGETVCRPFIFTANGSCGGALSSTVHLQDGATDLGTVGYTLNLGTIPILLSEGFDDIATLPGAGWYTQNNSQPVGQTAWFQGVTRLFDAQTGPANSYIAADYQNGSGAATISNWLLTPPLTLEDAAQLIFSTRTITSPRYPDRLQVRMSTNGSSANVGGSAPDVGGFTSLLLDINPTSTVIGYPTTWTQYTVTVAGVPSPTTGRLAFRYFSENGGPSGANSEYIGIDSVSYKGAPACATGDCAPLPVRAVSRKTHGGAGDFDVDLPLSGVPGIEPRAGGATNDYTLLITFSGDVAVNGNPQAQVTSGAGTVGSGGISNGGVVTIQGNVVMIPLTLVENQQTIEVALNGAARVSVTAPVLNISIPLSKLLADTNGDGAVNAADITETRRQSGQVTTPSNFRTDLSVDGVINSADITLVRRQSGSTLP